MDTLSKITRSLKGPNKLTIDRHPSGRVYLRSGTVRVARAIVLDLDQPGAYISHLFVKARYRRRGYGRRLLQALVKAIAEAGPTAISLHVEVDNTAAICLYKRVGFFIACTTTDVADRHYLMVKQLAPASL